MNNGTRKTLNVNYCLMSAKQKNAYYCSKASFWTYNIGDNVCDFSFFFLISIDLNAQKSFGFIFF